MKTRHLGAMTVAATACLAAVVGLSGTFHGCGAGTTAATEDGGLGDAGVAPVDAGHPPRPAVTIDSYPAVDGSTSTLPLARVIACELLGLDYRWEPGAGSEGESEIVPVAPTPAQQALADEVRARIVHHRTAEAFAGLIDRQADLILVANLPSEADRTRAASLGITLVSEPIALDALVIVVNAANPISTLTPEQIRSIYQAEITRWNELGGADQEIHPYVRPATSGSQQLFDAIVMQGQPMAAWPEDRRPAFMGTLIDRIREDPLAIGYSVYYWVTFQYPSEGYRVLAVDGTAPTAAAIASRSYPFTTEVWMVTRADLAPESAAGQVHDWLLTADGQTVVQRSGYVPVGVP